MISPQMMSAIAEFCEGNENLEHQSVMWIMQHMAMDSESDYFVNCYSYIYILQKEYVYFSYFEWEIENNSYWNNSENNG